MGFDLLNRLASLKSRGLSVQAQPPLAVDFGTGALKLLQITGGQSPALVAAAALDTPEELLADPVKRLQFQIDALPRLVKNAGFKTKRAVCGIPAAHTLVKTLQIPREPGVPLAALVRAAIPVQLNCDPAALVFRHVEVGEVLRGNTGANSGMPKTEVICLAARRELVDMMMAALRAAKLECVGIHSEYLATIRAFDGLTTPEKSLTTLYLDLGAGVTKVCIAHGQDLVFARGVDHAGLTLDRSLAKQLKCDLNEARSTRLNMEQVPLKQHTPAQHEGGLAVLAAAMMKEAGDPAAPVQRDEHGRPIAAVAPKQLDLSEALEILTDDVAMCIRYHQSMFPDRQIDRAIFVGGEARHRGLAQHIAKTLRLPAQVADPLARVARTGKEPGIGVDLRGSQPGWALAVGLALSPTDL